MPTPHRAVLIYLNNLKTKRRLLDIMQLNKPGTYILVLNLPSACDINVGALGRWKFSSGCYAYAGSAFGPGGLRARLRHHLISSAAPRWHIDYLRGFAEITEIWFTMDRRRLECIWAGVLGDLSDNSQALPGFGASDCRCRSHLIYFRHKPPARIFGRTVQVLKRKDFEFIA